MQLELDKLLLNKIVLNLTVLKNYFILFEIFIEIRQLFNALYDTLYTYLCISSADLISFKHTQQFKHQAIFLHKIHKNLL